METAIVSVICIALMVIGGMTMSRGFLSSVDSTSSNITTISQRNEAIMRTNVVVLTATQPSSDTISISLRNTGEIKLADFSKWDIIVQYTDAVGGNHVSWLPYVSSAPENNQWTLQGIYTNAATLSPEVFEPGIFNPDEEAIIICK